jgi:hypothetical protein
LGILIPEEEPKELNKIMKTFDTEKTVSYWLEGAEYDLGVANAMFKSKKYPYALFMGHLSRKSFSRHLLLSIQKRTLHSAIHFPT